MAQVGPLLQQRRFAEARPLLETLLQLEPEHPEALYNLGVLAKAAALGAEVSGVLVGQGVAGLVEQAGRFGASTVYVADDASVAAPLPQPRVDVIAAVQAAITDGADTSTSTRAPSVGSASGVTA